MLCAAALSLNVAAQEERPQITPGERKATKKKDAGPRALAVVQLAPNGKASLVPIAILINGKFWDATAYKADPVPMALDSGNVYEGERSGNSLGLFTVGSALHSNAVNSQTPWLGTGIWRPVGTEPVAKPAQAATEPVGLDNADGPPRLTRDTEKQAAPAKSAPASGSAPPTSNNPPSGSAPSGSHDSDGPPRLTKRDSSPDSSPTPQPAPAPASASTPAPSSTPAAPAKPADSKPDSKANIPTSDSGTAEANRPKLRRGKPAESFADDDIPGYSKPGAAFRFCDDQFNVD